MKKKFTLEIASPCSENFDKMIPNTMGFFCNSCAKNVIDLSRKTNSEVAKFIAETKDKNICARLKKTQLEEEFEYNEASKINNFKYAAIAAASILVTSNIVAQEKMPAKTEVHVTKPKNNVIVGKMINKEVTEKSILITVKGKLLEAKTNKPFDRKMYPNLMIAINGSEKKSEINPKTGEFLIPAEVLKNSKTLEITITGGDYYLSKAIPFTIKSVKNAILIQNIIIEKEELSRVMIAGGLGINYIQEK